MVLKLIRKIKREATVLHIIVEIFTHKPECLIVKSNGEEQ
jgi:hypothetical protein